MAIIYIHGPADRQISLLTRDRTWGNGMELSHGRFMLGVRERFFTQRVAEHWNRLPRKRSHYQACLSSRRCLADGGSAGESCAGPGVGLYDLRVSFPTRYLYSNTRLSGASEPLQLFVA